MGRVDWVRNFYVKQYEWADWRRRWSDFDPNERDPRVDAVTRHAGSEPLRILELGSGTGTTAAALAVAGHDVVTIEIQGELAAYTNELAAVVSGGSLRAIEGDFYATEPPGKFDVVAYFDGFGIGTDEDQRRLLRRIVGWLIPGGCALMDVLVPWYWSPRAGNEEEFPAGSGVRYLDGSTQADAA
jgi:SAM-dependent methyltransferase